MGEEWVWNKERGRKGRTEREWGVSREGKDGEGRRKVGVEKRREEEKRRKAGVGSKQKGRRRGRGGLSE